MSLPGSKLEEARRLVNEKEYNEAEQVYLSLLDKDSSQSSAAAGASVDDKRRNEQETSILELGQLYVTMGAKDKLREFIPHSTEYMMQFAKSKTVKVLKTLIEKFEQVPDSLDDQIFVCEKSIEFAKREKRVFLKHSLSIKLATLHYQKKQYKDSLALINDLLREFKKLDDKPSLVDVHLLESKVYHKLRNLAKSKASLTAARTAANSIYCPTQTVAELDLMSGILHCEDKDYKTAFSYFFESFESYHNLTTHNSYEKACQVLKYMLLSKIMLNLIDDVKNILNAKYTKETYQSRGIDAMKAVAEAYNNRSLLDFNTALKQYEKELMGDELTRSHFNALYDTLLESNLCKIIEPFERVEISHISKIIGLDTQQVEGKLSQMILDKIFYGVLDQGNGWLYVYETPNQDATYDSALELVGQLNKVVDQLFEKASVLY
ncbi:proteasome regulatory particle lid subunit RPN6 [Saccharomyces cerevisiae]|nr:Rpn6p [Saccharomyces cerevisiae YJM270]PTN22298.1 proteasome regulatory particle lid subunit RPN6 [Saccharomyces cerevisiae]PTN39915.1 proteasome regulatory particle lid subunit RPN6 [Saccharomyces cerevisiae]